MTLIDIMKLNKGIKVTMMFKGESVEARFVDMEGDIFYFATTERLKESEFKISMNLIGFILEIPLKVMNVEESHDIFKVTARINGKIKIFERRRTRRYPCFIPCDMMGRRCIILDVSNTGFKMLARSFHHVGAVITLSDGSRGVVVWERGGEKEPKEYGVYLLKISKRWRKLVRSIRNKYLEALRRIGEW